MARSIKVLWFVSLSLLAAASVTAWIVLATQEPLPPRNLAAEREQAAEAATTTYQVEPLGAAVEGLPAIAHLAIADLDADGLQDVVAADAAANQVTWVRQSPRGVFTEMRIAEGLPAPGRLAVADLNQDGRLDVVVAAWGRVLPNGDRIGRVVVLENAGENQFHPRLVAEHLARPTDVRVADLNADGRPDLVVGEFGPEAGGVSWWENQKEWKFERHAVSALPGVVATPVADLDGDGQPDIAVLSAQAGAVLRVFGNAGRTFRESVVWTSPAGAAAGGALELADLNADGRPDLVWTEGGNLHAGFPEPLPADGVHWLENRASGFVFHRLGSLPGASGVLPVDLDGDGDVDLLSLAPLHRGVDANAPCLTAWHNDGKQAFTAEVLAHDPIRLYAVAAGHLDDKGPPVLVTGALHVFPPVARLSRLTLWRHL